jgi:hypothetical protein
MPHLDRRSFIDLLDSLGSPDDPAVLAAAREVDRRVRESGYAWNDLLVPPPALAGSGDQGHAAVAAGGAPALAVTAEGDDLALIDRLLAGQQLSEETRRELEEFKAMIPAGEFGEMDARYLRSLAARLERNQAAVG